MKTADALSTFTDATLEGKILATLQAHPERYFDVEGVLSLGAFYFFPTDFQTVKKAALDGTPTLPPSPEWPAPSTNLAGDARRLEDLYLKRRLREATFEVAEGLNEGKADGAELLTKLETRAAEIRADAHEAAGLLQYASGLAMDVVADAEVRREQRVKTGKPVMGLLTGLKTLDERLNGMAGGRFYLLAGAPGTGKTTFALQVAEQVSRTTPVVFCSFENSPANLALRGICRQGQLNPLDVERGWVATDDVEAAAEKWKAKTPHLAFIEGSSRLTVDELRGRVRQAMNRAGVQQALVVVDYLQLWAKASRELEWAGDSRTRVEVMVERLLHLARQLNSPVLAISSYNREGTKPDAKAGLHLLKESSDLEYSADVALALTTDSKRMVAPPARAVDLAVLKNRHGEMGNPIKLIFRPDRADFREEAVAGQEALERPF